MEKKTNPAHFIAFTIWFWYENLWPLSKILGGGSLVVRKWYFHKGSPLKINLNPLHPKEFKANFTSDFYTTWHYIKKLLELAKSLSDIWLISEKKQFQFWLNLDLSHLQVPVGQSTSTPGLNIWEKAISILAGNFNLDLSYLFTTVPVWQSTSTLGLNIREKAISILAGNLNLGLSYLTRTEAQSLLPTFFPSNHISA